MHAGDNVRWSWNACRHPSAPDRRPLSVRPQLARALSNGSFICDRSLRVSDQHQRAFVDDHRRRLARHVHRCRLGAPWPHGRGPCRRRSSPIPGRRLGHARSSAAATNGRGAGRWRWHRPAHDGGRPRARHLRRGRRPRRHRDRGCRDRRDRRRGFGAHAPGARAFTAAATAWPPRRRRGRSRPSASRSMPWSPWHGPAASRGAVRVRGHRPPFGARSPCGRLRRRRGTPVCRPAAALRFTGSCGPAASAASAAGVVGTARFRRSPAWRSGADGRARAAAAFAAPGSAGAFAAFGARRLPFRRSRAASVTFAVPAGGGGRSMRRLATPPARGCFTLRSSPRPSRPSPPRPRPRAVHHVPVRGPLRHRGGLPRGTLLAALGLRLLAGCGGGGWPAGRRLAGAARASRAAEQLRTQPKKPPPGGALARGAIGAGAGGHGAPGHSAWLAAAPAAPAGRAARPDHRLLAWPWPSRGA